MFVDMCEKPTCTSYQKVQVFSIKRNKLFFCQCWMGLRGEVEWIYFFLLLIPYHNAHKLKSRPFMWIHFFFFFFFKYWRINFFKCFKININYKKVPENETGNMRIFWSIRPFFLTIRTLPMQAETWLIKPPRLPWSIKGRYKRYQYCNWQHKSNHISGWQRSGTCSSQKVFYSVP